MKDATRIRIKGFQNVFTKLTAAFILLGVLPLFFVSIVFQYRYTGSMESVAEKYFTQIDNYYARNLQNLVESADAAMGYIYEYNNSSYRYLYQMIQDPMLNQNARDAYLTQMLKTVKLKCDYATSIRFWDCNGKKYSVFYEQGKSLRDSAKFSWQNFYTQNDNLQKMRLKAAYPEGNFCRQSEDYVVTLAKNYMNMTQDINPEIPVFGTICLDINVNRLDVMVDKLKVEDSKEIFILDRDRNQVIYSNNKSSYGRLQAMSGKELKDIRGLRGNYVSDGRWVFFNRIGNSQRYAMIVTDRSGVLSAYLKNNGYFISVVGMVIFLLFAVYIAFSNRISEPVRNLTKAMSRVQNGDLSARVEVISDDELGYVGKGFNQMVEDLDYYIKKVYEARLMQKEAELNALKLQIQPHYLYNTLDIIRMTALKHEDHETAQLLESLSGQLHYVIGYEGERVELFRELNNVKNYFVILKTRYENKYTVNINVANQDLSLRVPKLLLQPMVENAVKHGFRPREGRGTVNITVVRHEGFLEITVMDNGVGMNEKKLQELRAVLRGEHDGKPGTGVGMKNVYDRIKMDCGEQFGFTIYSEENMGVVIRFRLPIWEES